MIRVGTITMKSTDAPATARFWRDLLGYSVGPNHSDSVLLIGDGPDLLIQPADEAQTGTMIHLDLRTDDHDEAVARALALGGARADIGQRGTEGWTVLRDPAGNLFCILKPSTESAPGMPTVID